MSGLWQKHFHLPDLFNSSCSYVFPVSDSWNQVFRGVYVKQSLNKITQRALREGTRAQMLTLPVDYGIKLMLVPSL